MARTTYSAYEDAAIRDLDAAADMIYRTAQGVRAFNVDKESYHGVDPKRIRKTFALVKKAVKALREAQRGATGYE